MNDFGINFTLSPQFDVAAFNVVLSQMKKSMGDAGKNIKLIDEKEFNKEMDSVKKKFEETLNAGAKGGAETGKALDDISKKAKSAGESAGMFSKAFQFTQTVQAVTQISNAIQEVTRTSIEYEASLAAVGAITGFSGEKLDKLGESARQLAIQFGTSATSQLSSFQGILSKLGPAIAEDSEALALFGRNVNILSAASGDDAATSTNAITNAMLQMGLAMGTPMEQAQNSTKVINALAAGAQVGAAEIPQVGEALVAAGVAAKGANMDIVGINAAIQVMAVGGKTGAEAGTALRNVLGLLQNASGPAEIAMSKLGTSSKELGNLLTTQGLDVAMAKVKDGMNTLGSDAEKNATLMQIFGTENASAAGILMDNLDKYTEFSDGIKAGMEGTGSAFVQAEMRMNTSEGMIARSKAAIEDVLISLGSTLGNTFTTIASTASSFAPMVTTFAGLGTMFPTESAAKFATTLASRLVPSLFIADAATKSTVLSKEAYNAATIKGMASEAGHTILVGAKTAAVGVATAAQWLWNAAISANPIGLLIAGTAALIGVVALVADAMNESAAEREESLQKENAAVDQQIENNKKQQERVKTNQSLIDSYEQLGSKSQRTAEEEAKYRDVQIELAKTYPSVISGSNSFSQNLEGLKKKSAESGEALKKYQTELKQLESKKLDISIGIKQAQGEQIGEQINDVFSSWSGAEQSAKLSMQKYMTAMKNAQSESELAKIGTDMKMAIFSDPKFASLGAEEKNKLVQLSDNYTKNLSDSMKLNQAKASTEIKKAVDESFANGTEVSPATLAKIALSTNKPIAEIEKMYSEIKAKANNAKIDEAITKSFELKGKINGAEQINSLTSEYEKAVNRLNELKTKQTNGGLSDTETKEFDTLSKKAQETADKIGAIAPASKTNFRTVIDEAGNIKTVFDVNIDKAKEFANQQKNTGNNEAQTNFTKLLGQQVDVMDTQKSKLADLKVQIDATNDPQKKQELINKYNDENASIVKNRDTLIDAMVRGANAGLSIDDSVSKLAKSMNITNEEAKKLVLSKALKEASASGELTKEKIAEIATKYKSTTDSATALLEEQKKNTKEAQNTAGAASNIYTAYDEAYKKMSENHKATIDKINALESKQRKEGLTEAEQAELTKFNSWAKYSTAQLKSENKIREENNKEFDASYKEQTKQAKDSSDTILKIKQENAALEQKIKTNGITEEEAKAREEKRIALQSAEDKINVEIQKIAKLKKPNAQELEQKKLLNEQLKLTQELNSKEMLEFEVNIAKKTLAEKAKLEESNNKAILETKKTQLEALEKTSETVSSNSDYIANLEAQKELKIAILQDEGKKQIEELLSNNESYKKAEEQRLALMALSEAKKRQMLAIAASNGSDSEKAKIKAEFDAIQEQLKKANDDIKTFESDFSNTEVVKSINVKVKSQVDDSTEVYDEKISTAKIKSIENQAIREREIAIAEAAKTYKEELEQAEGNENLKFLAFVKFQNAKVEAEQEYLGKSKEMSDILLNNMQTFTKSLGQSFAENAINPVDEAIKKLKDKLGEDTSAKKNSNKEQYDKDVADFKESASKKVLSSTEMYNKIGKIAESKRQIDEDNEKKQSAALVKFQLGVANSFLAISTSYSKQASKNIEEAFATIKKNTDKIKKENREGTATLSEIFEGSTQKLVDFSYSAVGSGVASMATMLAAGEEFGKSFRLGLLANLIQTAEQAILTYIPQIYGSFFAWMGPWGLAAATGAIALVYGGLEVAKSSLGAFRGAVDIEGPGTETSDSIPARLSKRESVLTAEATKQHTNIELFKWLNATPRPAYEFYMETMPELFEYKSVMTPVIIEHDRIMEITRERILNIEEIMLVQEIANNTRSMDRKLDRLEVLPNLLDATERGNFNRKSKLDMGLDVNIKTDANSFIKEIEFQKRKSMRNG